MRKKHKKLTTFENVVIFPGTVERLIAQAHEHVENYRYDLANKSFAEALNYTEGDEMTLSVYAYSLYEAKSFEEAKEVCEQLLSIGPSMYLEVMELYLTICMQLKQFKQVESIISSLLEEEAIPEEQVEKFQRLKELNANIASNNEHHEELTQNSAHFDFDSFSIERFLSLSPNDQLLQIHDLTAANIQPIIPQLRAIIENEQTHSFIKSLLLILLVEQNANIDVNITKFGRMKHVNTAELELPTKLPQYNQVLMIILDKLEQEPSILEMVQFLISKHAIVTYPFEWLDYDSDDIALSYIDFVRAMFGNVQEMDYELVEFIQNLENLTELQQK